MLDSRKIKRGRKKMHAVFYVLPGVTLAGLILLHILRKHISRQRVWRNFAFEVLRSIGKEVEYYTQRSTQFRSDIPHFKLRIKASGFHCKIASRNCRSKRAGNAGKRIYEIDGAIFVTKNRFIGLANHSVMQSASPHEISFLITTSGCENITRIQYMLGVTDKDDKLIFVKSICVQTHTRSGHNHLRVLLELLRFANHNRLQQKTAS